MSARFCRTFREYFWSAEWNVLEAFGELSSGILAIFGEGLESFDELPGRFFVVFCE